MRALALSAIGLEHVAVRDVATPELAAPDDVRVRVRAAAFNHLDLFVARGLPGVEYVFPQVMGSDAAGVVDAVGPGVTAWRPGDRVMINPGISCGRCAACAEGEESLCERFGLLGEHRSGTIGEYVVVPAANLGRVPDAMPWELAAAFSLSALTAWRMLTTRAQVKPGETVLVWGAGGGVALAAVQIASLLGARVIATSSSAAKLALAQTQGAAEIVNHREADVVAEVRRLTNRRGADVVIDSVGEATWINSLRALRRGGRLVTCGATTGPQVTLDLRRLFWHQWSLLGSTMGSRREYAEIVRLAHDGKLWPVVDRTVPLADAVAALRRLEGGEQAGKLVIEVAP